MGSIKIIDSQNSYDVLSLCAKPQYKTDTYWTQLAPQMKKKQLFFTELSMKDCNVCSGFI